MEQVQFEAWDGAASGLGPGGPWGVWGDSGSEKGATGPGGESEDNGNGVVGTCDGGTGVWGQTNSGTGVQGTSSSGTGVTGLSDAGTGVAASTASGYGVYATAGGGVGVYATADTGIAVLAVSQEQDAVNGTSAAPGHAGVSGVNTAAATGRVPSAIGVYANSNNTGLLAQGDPAGYFAGDVLVTGDVVMLNANSADIAEEFDCAASAEPLEPGTVVVIDPDGRLAAGEDAYDTRVAGVVSGGGTLKPALLLQSFDSSRPRSPIALLGKVYCKVDAGYAPIVAGDLLTTSQTRGHAMKATDRNRALGAVIGKALESVSAGSSMIPILVSLR